MAKKEKAPAPNWVTELGEDWKAAYGGTAPFGQIGRVLKPLVDEHGPDVVRWCWTLYLKHRDWRFSGPRDFADKSFGVLLKEYRAAHGLSLDARHG